MDFSHQRGHFLTRNQPLAMCNKSATALGRDDIHPSGSTGFYDGGGCC